MSLSDIELGLLALTVGSTTLLGIYGILANFSYDVVMLRRHKALREHPRQRVLRYRPLVTIVVYAHNDEASISQCLESIRQSSYRKWQLLVADNASNDATAEIIQSYITSHPKLNMRLIRKKRIGSHEAVLTDAFKRWGKGDLRLNLAASDMLPKNSLKQIADYMAINPQTTDVLLAQLPVQAYKVRIVWQQFSLAALNWLRKADIFSVVRHQNQFGAVSRTGRLKSRRSAYAADIGLNVGLKSPLLAYSRPIKNRSYARSGRTLAWWVSGLAVAVLALQILLVPYLIYIAWEFNNPIFLAAYCILFVALAIIITIGNNTLKIADKLMLVIHLPLLLGGLLLYSLRLVISSIYSVIQLITSLPTRPLKISIWNASK